MQTIRLCPNCAAALAPDAPGGLCPQCLLGSHELTASDETGTHARSGPEPGAQFGGYQIIRLLGAGGMGAVYEAGEIETGRRVALKVLRHAPESPTARQRFLREGRLAAAVNHSNSVYIYGAEEIEGAPVITMEYVRGGTLSDLLKQRGPLPVGEAVDAILQIIAGLEAAASKGVLHRDVKPSNCFMDAGGEVKVGDFGLSISTLARDQTALTLSGAIMGTPAYAPPEQLRGDELDVRADIYSVGATLFQLLTGKTPFHAANMVSLVATVLEKPAPSPRQLRPGIPKGIEQVVLRCMEKEPRKRFSNYEDLRRALLPFSSSAPVPAPLGVRAVANALDQALWMVPAYFMTLAFFSFREPSFTEPVSWITFIALQVLYFGITEGLWGASAGKWLCGIRVDGPGRGAPGLPRATARALLFFGVTQFSAWLWFASGTAPDKWPVLNGILLFSAWYLFLPLFITARRSNGLAAVHDLLTGTRVVEVPLRETRPRIAAVDESNPEADGAPDIGTFHVLELLARREGEELLLGYDTRLLRRVWIWKRAPGVPPVSDTERNVARPGRLHWLAGRRSAAESWDVFEAPAGRALTGFLSGRQSWEQARFWLQDLGEELLASLREGSWPGLPGLDRVWITGDGRAKFLPFAAPGSATTGLPSDARAIGQESLSNATAIRFLGEAARAILRWEPITARPGSAPASGAPIQAHAHSHAEIPPLPIPARRFLRNLPSAQNLDAVVHRLGELTAEPAVVSRTRRGVILLGCLLPLIALVGAVWFAVALSSMVPELIPVAGAMTLADVLMTGVGRWGIVLWLPSLLTTLALGRGPLFHLLKIEIVASDGARAGRGRAFLRCLIAWLPLMLMFAALWAGVEWLFWPLALVAAGGCAYVIAHPQRALQDRLSGTWLAPGERTAEKITVPNKQYLTGNTHA